MATAASEDRQPGSRAVSCHAQNCRVWVQSTADLEYAVMLAILTSIREFMKSNYCTFRFNSPTM